MAIAERIRDALRSTKNPTLQWIYTTLLSLMHPSGRGLIPERTLIERGYEALRVRQHDFQHDERVETEFTKLCNVKRRSDLVYPNDVSNPHEVREPEIGSDTLNYSDDD